MRIVVAPDSYKGSLTSIQAADMMKQGVEAVNPNNQVIQKPMADGGEGTLDSLLTAGEGRRIPITCCGPLGLPINTAYAIVDEDTAIIECATIAGLTQVPESERHPHNTTTYGIGEVMRDALDKGCRTFILGLGGSATNDGGLGMLKALGMTARDETGEETGVCGSDMHEVRTVDLTAIEPRLADITMKVACDVDNPLSGKRGATYVYGPQKGLVDADDLASYDSALNRFGEAMETASERSLRHISGAGAAGGLGMALMALGGELVSGSELLAGAMHIEDAIRQADLVLTGEGMSDEQTLYGKAPGHVGSLAKKYNVPAVLLSGSLCGEIEKLQEHFAGCFSILQQPMSLEASMEKADELLFQQTKQVVHLVQQF